VFVVNVQLPFQNRRLAQLMKLRLHTSICSPLVERDHLAVDHRFVQQGGGSRGRSPGRQSVREAPRFDAALADLIAAVRAQGLEGLVAKRLDSVYEPGGRSGAWRKMRLSRLEEFVIGGYTKGGRTFDAIVIGNHEGDRLVYVARTRVGFTPASREWLMGSCGRSRSPSVRSRISRRRARAGGGRASRRRS